MELYGGGQLMSIHRAFYQPLIQRSGLLAATKKAEARRCVIVLGGGWKTGNGFVKPWWETTNGGDGSRPVRPLGREQL